MKDNEIIQVLKNHIEAENCVNCESFGRCDEFLLTEKVLDLISRQQAEIERLKEENMMLNTTVINQCALNKQNVYFAHVESIREFVKRLKEAQKNSTIDSRICTTEMIDNLVKEMEQEG